MHIKKKKKPDNLEDADTVNFLPTSLKVVTLDIFLDDFLVSCVLLSNKLAHMEATRRLNLGF